MEKQRPPESNEWILGGYSLIFDALYLSQNDGPGGPQGSEASHPHCSRVADLTRRLPPTLLVRAVLRRRWRRGRTQCVCGASGPCLVASAQAAQPQQLPAIDGQRRAWGRSRRLHHRKRVRRTPPSERQSR